VKKWEYDVIHFDLRVESGTILIRMKQKLNELGKTGWEAVNSTEFTTTEYPFVYILLKREIPETKAEPTPARSLIDMHAVGH
jgi:hypothetical protein